MNAVNCLNTELIEECRMSLNNGHAQRNESGSPTEYAAMVTRMRAWLEQNMSLAARHCSPSHNNNTTANKVNH